LTKQTLRRPEEDFVDAAMLTCLQIHEAEEDGDVLVFLPGQDEIEALAGLLQENLKQVAKKGAAPGTFASDFDIKLLYAAMQAI